MFAHVPHSTFCPTATIILPDHLPHIVKLVSCHDSCGMSIAKCLGSPTLSELPLTASGTLNSHLPFDTLRFIQFTSCTWRDLMTNVWLGEVHA